MSISNMLFSFSGRIGRMSYFLLSFIVGLVAIVSLVIAVAGLARDISSPVAWIVMLIALFLGAYVQAALLTKRIRDIGKGLFLVWAYYGSFFAGLMFLAVGAFSPMFLTVAYLAQLFGSGILIYAWFKRGSGQEVASPGGYQSQIDWNDNSNDQSPIGNNADEIIARALAERKLAVQQGTVAQAQARQAEPAGFGRRQRQAFGTR